MTPARRRICGVVVLRDDGTALLQLRDDRPDTVTRETVSLGDLAERIETLTGTRIEKLPRASGGVGGKAQTA